MKVISIFLFAILAVVVLEVNGFYDTSCSCPQQQPCEVRWEVMPPKTKNSGNSTRSLNRRIGNSRLARGRKANKRSKPGRTRGGKKRSPSRKSKSARNAAKRSAKSITKPRQVVSNKNIRAPSAGRRRQRSKGRKSGKGRRSG